MPGPRRAVGPGRAGPIVRQFRHKHQIVDHTKKAQHRLVRAREKVAAERVKCGTVNAEHTQVLETVNTCKEKIKALVTLIRSLALSRTRTQSRKSTANQLEGVGNAKVLQHKDAAQIIDGHLHTILALLPQHERKIQRLRTVVYDDLDGGAQLATGAMPISIDEVCSVYGRKCVCSDSAFACCGFIVFAVRCRLQLLQSVEIPSLPGTGECQEAETSNLLTGKSAYEQRYFHATA